ncbi:hypothetical protein PIB30_036555 [Stylosanthes scabra]|uniref:Uncharacterized protein n=1 Tax=Stylosanthes scabra TaxID=79078 RepID=A0ABU6WBV1_9FABA|nr:hypothetical protein [Stylosanthes scabra]
MNRFGEKPNRLTGYEIQRFLRVYAQRVDSIPLESIPSRRWGRELRVAGDDAAIGAPECHKKMQFWDELSNVMYEIRVPFLVGGDFNEITAALELSLSQNDMRFKKWIEFREFVDLDLCGRKYTWYEGRSCNRVDRVLVEAN